MHESLCGQVLKLYDREIYMREFIMKNTVKCSVVIFVILIAVHAFEAIILRMDETVFGENFINKLFGIWHIVTPLHNLIDGDLDPAGFVGLSFGYIILAGIMGIKWAMLYQITGSLYMGMADHFCNNCIATNLLHITTGSGTDELMIMRVMIAQLLSFIIVTIYWIKWKKNHIQSA